MSIINNRLIQLLTGFNLEFGALGGNRTHDPRLRKPVLYPTELRTRDAHHNKKMSKVKYINADKHH